MDFIESDEQQMLREAVGAIASKFGHELLRREGPRRRAHRRAVERRWPRRASSGSTSPRSTAAAGGGISELAAVHEELAAAGCPLLVIVVSPAICATIIAQLRHRGAEAALAAPLRHRGAQDGLRHHRARRRLELATTCRSPRPRTATSTGSTGRSTTSPGVDECRGRPGGHPHRASTRTPAGAGCPSSSSTSTRPGLDKHAAPGRDHRPGEAVHPVLRQRRGGGRPADRRPRATGCARSSSASTPSASCRRPRPTASAATPWTRRPTTPTGRGGLGHAHRPPPGDLPSAGQGQDRGRAGPADDRQGGLALRPRRRHRRGRRGGQHGQVRGGRGRAGRARPGHPDPRRQRDVVASTAWPTCGAWPACSASPRSAAR